LKSEKFYNIDYFENGKNSGKSNYVGYKWNEDKYSEQVDFIETLAGIQPPLSVLDFGCAKGFLVNALRSKGYSAIGQDISEYAIQMAMSEVREYCHLVSGVNAVADGPSFDLICSVHLLEHFSLAYVKQAVGILLQSTKKAVFLIPVGNGSRFNNPVHENDPSHVLRETPDWWGELFANSGAKSITVKDFRTFGGKSDVVGWCVS